MTIALKTMILVCAGMTIKLVVSVSIMYDLWHACCNGDKCGLLCYETLCGMRVLKTVSRTGSPQGGKKQQKHEGVSG
jgi:hypothetical protein